MTIPTISALPTAPSRDDPATFADRADAMVSALPTMVTQINAATAAIPAEIDALALDAAADATAPYTSAAAASAVSAAAARDLSIAAWAASMTPAETLPAISQSLHIGAIVAAKIYDTSKDTDGGAWRKRCQHTSWYSEALGGNRWIGQQASIAAAWTAAGSTTGAVFQASATAGPLTIGKYYAATSGTTATEVFRGVKAEFPAVAAIVAETGRVVIYDMTVPVPAMWMVFKSAATTTILYNGASVTCVAALQGVVFAGQSATVGYARIDFLRDHCVTHRYDANGFNFSNVGNRNVGSVALALGYFGAGTVSQVTNAIAGTVLPGAPVDPATGLPVQTIAVATAGGVSVIKSDGTVVNSANTYNHGNLTIDSAGRLYSLETAVGSLYSYGNVGSLASAFAPIVSAYVYGTGIPALLGAIAPTSRVVGHGGEIVIGMTTGVSVLRENPTTRAKGMLANIAAAYPGMWQVGDSKRAWLCDATAETVTGSELVTNGTFATDASGWTVRVGTLASSASAGLMTNDAAMSAYADQILTTVVGKTYVVSGTITLGTSANPRVGVSNTLNSGTLGLYQATASGPFRITFTATATGTYLALFQNDNTTGATTTFDNISCRLAEPDRSVKSEPIPIYGSLTKTLVGGVATYSGFSASNYLEEAYSADLDFGTGDFCIIGWQLLPNFSMPVAALHRSMAASAGGMLVQTSTTSGEIVVYLTASSTFTAIGSPMQSTAGVWQMIAYVRRSGVLESYLDGRLSSSVSNSTNITYANAVTRVGARLDSPNAPGHSIAMWRLGATAPSADQIAQIYRDELALFQTSAVGTLAGSSSAVTALDYDDSTDLLHVGTSTHRSAFRGLTRVSSEATPAGAIASLSASGGAVLTGGTSGYLYQPALLLRDEIKRRDEARRALGKEVVFFDYDAVTSQVAFVLPKGYTTKAVYSAGTLKRLGSTKDYTTSTDGYAETVTFGAAPGNTVWVSIMATRSC